MQVFIPGTINPLCYKLHIAFSRLGMLLQYRLYIEPLCSYPLRSSALGCLQYIWIIALVRELLLDTLFYIWSSIGAKFFDISHSEFPSILIPCNNLWHFSVVVQFSPKPVPVYLLDNPVLLFIPIVFVSVYLKHYQILVQRSFFQFVDFWWALVSSYGRYVQDI